MENGDLAVVWTSALITQCSIYARDVTSYVIFSQEGEFIPL